MMISKYLTATIWTGQPTTQMVIPSSIEGKMDLFMASLVRHCSNKSMTCQEAVERFQLTNAEEIELIVILKSMERSHGKTAKT